MIKKSVINIYVMMLIQTVKYNESVIEAEYGNEGYSIVNYERSYSLNRALINGRWIVYRGEKGKDIQQPMKEFEICDSYIHESIKSWIDKDQYLSILDKIDLKEGYNIKLESKKITKVIEIKDIKECIEEKVVNNIKYNDTNFSYTGNPKDIPSIIEYLKGIGTQTPAKNVLTESGKLTFIVDPEILGTVLHYLLADFLNGNMPKFKLNEKILGEITIYDNPLNLFSPSFSVFDDEGVKTK
ncbi:MAG: metallopeptidase TldD-related protein, partial [Saccharolobus sp.]